MSVPLGLSLVSAVVCTGCAVAILLHDSLQSVNRTAALLIGGAAVWAMGDVFRITAPDAQTALLAARATAIGWAFIGPLALHLILCAVGRDTRRVQRLLPASYAGGAVFLVLSLTTSWLARDVYASPSGWQVTAGPGLSVFYAFTMLHVVPAIGVGYRYVRSEASPSDRGQASWLAVGIAVPLVVGSITGAILPIFGMPAPPLETPSFAFLGVMIAFTSYRHGQSPLARSTFSRQILDSHPDGMALVLFSGDIASASHGLARLVGKSSAELVGRPLADFLDTALVTPPREVRDLEGGLLTVTGLRIPIAISTRILRDKLGLPFALVVVTRDLREVVALRSRLVTSGRLAAIGQLAAGIAHEINNPMAFVRSNLILVRQHWTRIATGMDDGDERWPLVAEGEELLDESLEGVERTAAIVRDIKGFAHAGTGRRGEVQLAGLLDNVLRVASPQLHHDIRVERDYADVPSVIGAPQELKQVFLNLVVNAAQSIGGRGTVRVTAHGAGRRVQISVRDDGAGIPADMIEKVFDPFFTTKPVGEGTGLGLFLSYQIVRNNEGEIAVDSELGVGTTVTVSLPAADDVDTERDRA